MFMSVKKSGVLSKKELDFISENLDFSDEVLAEQLGRNVETISKHRKKILADRHIMGDMDMSAWDLKSRPFWENLQHQFLPREIKVFEYEWNRIIQQFNEDLLATEELQVYALITTGILLSRNLEERKQAAEQLERLNNLLQLKYRIPEGERDMMWQQETYDLENQVAAIRASSKSNTDERVKLEGQRSSYLKDLKATRDQRLQKSTEGTVSWTALLRQLEDEEVRKTEGRYAGLIDLAAQKEVDRLSDYHTYDDLGIDRPILNAETVLKDEGE
jgi:hypothetical protein